MTKAPAWPRERLEAMETPQLKQLMANASQRGATALAAECEAVLLERAPKPKQSPSSSAKRRTGDFVAEFHFVCENDRGVTSDGERFFWSGSWVVSEQEVVKSIQEGAKLALHNSREDLSYRQGKIIDYRKTDGDTGRKRSIGIEFLVAADDQPLAWFGDGTGEKGYRWASDARNDEQAER